VGTQRFHWKSTVAVLFSYRNSNNSVLYCVNYETILFQWGCSFLMKIDRWIGWIGNELSVWTEWAGNPGIEANPPITWALVGLILWLGFIIFIKLVDWFSLLRHRKRVSTTSDSKFFSCERLGSLWWQNRGKSCVADEKWLFESTAPGQKFDNFLQNAHDNLS